MLKDLSREELFILVWERPIEDIAKDFGISGMALSKHCKKLSIPKPSRAHWAKIQSGKKAKKPLLKEFSERLETLQQTRVENHLVKRGSVGLTPLQADIFRQAIGALEAAEVDLEDLYVTRNSARLVSGELAAQLLIVIQRQHNKWLKKRAGSQEVAHSAVRSVHALVAKILPLAKAHTMILQSLRGKYETKDQGPHVVIRLTPAFKQQVANLHRLVIEHNLCHVVWDLNDFEHAWIVQYHYHHEDYARATGQLCISAEYLWIRGKVIRRLWKNEREEMIETLKIPINTVAPVELIPVADIAVPAIVEPRKLKLSKKRIKAFQQLEQIYDILSNAIYRHDIPPIPDDHLVLLEKLHLGPGSVGPLTAARETSQKLEEDFEHWELAMEAERESICGDILGLSVGDTIITESHGKPVRLKINRMSMYLLDNDKLNFHIRGARYRQDGLLGKREEMVEISTS